MESIRTTPTKKKLTTSDMARADNTVRHEEHDAPDGHDEHNPAHDDHTITVAQPERMARPAHMDQPGRMENENPSPLMSEDMTKDFRARWQNIQTQFVDEPRQAVEQADELVAEIMQQLAQSFSDQRSRLESEWGHSEQASTEDLRVALRRYRSFFDRLLSF